MKCPYCKTNNHKVVDKRSTDNDTAIRRRRECEDCNKRFTTYERIESVSLIIIKKDKRREQFDKSKLERGLLKACEKRPVSYEEIKKIVDEIEIELRNMDSIEIPSKKIGKIVMKKLKKLDKIAYIRFASVYKEFKDIDSFEKEITKIKK
ncbi:transcriptional repressor NrdR [Candidatus Woesearchaeota archaeon]|nr:transcriptional repressor NrdR [Candidatus Woesearchaeota archaeon]